MLDKVVINYFSEWESPSLKIIQRYYYGLVPMAQIGELFEVNNPKNEFPYTLSLRDE